MALVIVTPTYNEKESLPEAVKKAFEFSPPDTSVLIVDDNSPDGTGRLADELAGSDSRIKVLHRRMRNGLGRAYMDGFKYALENMGAQYIITMDGDLSHDPSFIPEFLKNMPGCDLVVGSRYYKGRVSIVNWPMSRLLLSYGASVYVRLFAGIALSDPTSGFRCFSRNAVEKILRQGIISDGYAFSIEINYLFRRWGLKAREIPIIFYDRNKGASKMHKLGTMFEAMAIVWRAKFIRLVEKPC